MSTAHILKDRRTEGLVGSNGVHCKVILVKRSLTSISDLSGIWTEGCTPTALKILLLRKKTILVTHLKENVEKSRRQVEWPTPKSNLLDCLVIDIDPWSQHSSQN